MRNKKTNAKTEKESVFFETSGDLIKGILIAIPFTFISWGLLIFIFGAFGN